MNCPVCNKFKALDDIMLMGHIKQDHYWEDMPEILELLVGIAKTKNKKK